MLNFTLTRSRLWHRLVPVVGSFGLIGIAYEVLRLTWSVVSPATAFFWPSSWSILGALAGFAGDPEVIAATLGTLIRVGLSFLLTLIVGYTLGALLGLSERVYRFVRPGWDFLRSVPPSVLFPLLVIVFGIGVLSKVVTAAGTASLIMALAVADGVRGIDRGRVAVYRNLGVPKSKVFLKIVLPEVVLGSWSSMRIVASLVVALIIITEMFLGSRVGVGSLVIKYSESFQFPRLFAVIALAGMMGYLVNVIVERLEFHAQRLREGERVTGESV